MKRYVDFRADDWADRTDSHMQAVRWSACLDGLGSEPPQAGVIDTYPLDILAELIGEGWVAPLGPIHEDEMLREDAREAVMSSIRDDLDCLSTEEHMLVERMLISGGSVALDSVADMEAAYTLRMRLWSDLGVENGGPAARLDAELMEVLPNLLMRPKHLERRSRIFIFEGMLHGLLYINGYLDDRMPCDRFISEVLEMEETPKTLRLARNYLEATFDTYTLSGCNLLIHEAVADPEAFAQTLAQQGAFQMPEVTSNQLAASMNGLLPEETLPDEKLQRALLGALRPEYEPGDAASDLRFLVKQGAPMATLQEIMASMLCVIPTPHMDGALRELRQQTPRWVNTGVLGKPARNKDDTLGTLH